MRGSLLTLLLLPAALSAESFVALARESAIEAERARAPAAPAPPPMMLVAMTIELPSPQRGAGVLVHVAGIRLVDPGLDPELAADEGHLHYRVDDGPVLETSATNVAFTDLAKGRHFVSVSLAANDHSPLGPAETVVVRIP